MPTMDAAIDVVSDKGNILSPNSAPNTTAPATIAGFAPNAAAIPKNATPTVAQVAKPLPNAKPTTDDRANADK